MLREHKTSGKIIALFLDTPVGDAARCLAYDSITGEESVVCLAEVMKQTKLVPLWPVGVDVFARLTALGYQNMTCYYRSNPSLAEQRKKIPPQI
jgi:hypothetical protein